MSPSSHQPGGVHAERGLEVLLLEEKLVAEEALRQARRVALRRRVPLLEVLIEEHALDEGQIADVVARRLSLPRVTLTGLSLDEEALREVPHDLAAAHLVIPIHLDAGSDGDGAQRTLRLATANPLDTYALDDIAHATGCALELVVAPLSELRAAILRSYRGLITRMIPRAPDGPRRAGEPTTAPHLQLPDESSLEVRLRAVVELLVDRGVLSTAELEERVRRLVRGEDV